MNKKKILTASLLTLLLFPLVGCGESKPVHEHAFYPVKAKEATCIEAGNIAYDQCIYCKEIRINGVVKTLEDVTLAIDPNNHVNPTEVEYKAATCTHPGIKAYTYCDACKKYMVDGQEVSEDSLQIPADPTKHVLVHVDEIEATCLDGIKAHDKCSECNKYFVNGQEVSEESLIIPADKDHNFTQGDVCSVCKNAYRVKLSDGQYEVIDSNNALELKTLEKGLVHYSGNKHDYFPEIIKNKNSVSIQKGSSSSTFTRDGTAISYKYAGKDSTFARLTLGDKDGKEYIGRALFGYEFTINKDVNPIRVGMKLVNETASTLVGSIQDNLLGSKSNEENNPSRLIKGNVTYRFVYEIEVTAGNQIVQLFNELPYSCEFKLDNFVFVPLEGEVTQPTNKLLYFGQTDMAKNEK